MKKPSGRLITILVCLALAFFAATTASAAETDAREPITVDLSNIYNLAYKNGLSARIADLNLKAFYNGLEDLQESLDAAWEMAGMPGEVGEYGSQLLRQLMAQQVSRESREKTVLGIESAKKQAALGAQSMLVAYYGLLAQKAGLEASREQLERGLSAAKTMLSLGMITADSVDELDRSLKQMEAAVGQLANAARTLKAKLALYIGEDEERVNIAPFGGIPAEEASLSIAAIDYEADFAKAKENCYTLKIQELTVSDSKGVQKEIESATLFSMKSEFPFAFLEKYLALQEKAAALINAESACKAGERELEIASLKLSLGMISGKAHKDAASQLEAARSSLALAQLDFIAARSDYLAMVDGIWFREAVPVA